MQTAMQNVLQSVHDFAREFTSKENWDKGAQLFLHTGFLQGAGFGMANGESRLAPLASLSEGAAPAVALREAFANVRAMSGESRVGAFRAYAGEIAAASKGSWSAAELGASNGTVFAGRFGDAVVFDGSGNMFRGNLVRNAEAFVPQQGGGMTIDYSKLTPVQ